MLDRVLINLEFCILHFEFFWQDAKRAVLGNFYDKDLTISHISSY